MRHFTIGAPFAQGSEVTQADLDAIAAAAAASKAQEDRLQAARRGESTPRPTSWQRGDMLLAQRLRDAAADRLKNQTYSGTPAEIAAQMARDRTEVAVQTAVLDDAKSKVRGEIGLLMLLTAPAWGPVLFNLLLKR